MRSTAQGLAQRGRRCWCTIAPCEDFGVPSFEDCRADLERRQHLNRFAMRFGVIVVRHRADDGEERVGPK